MHRKTKRLVSALLAAVLCAAAALPAGAEPWTYEVDDVMGTYGVEYYADVGFENPTRNTDTAAQGTTGVSTYGADAAQYAAVDSGLGYTTTQLPGGITLYSPTDTGVSTYAMDTDFAVESDVATYAASGNEQITGTDSNGTQTFSITIPTTLELEDTAQTMTLTGEVKAYSTLQISVDKDGEQTLKCSNNGTNGRELGYTLSRADLEVAGYTKTDWKAINDNGSWDNTIQTDVTVKYFRTSLTAQLADNNNYDIAGTYTDTLTFTMTSSHKRFNVTYNANYPADTTTAVDVTNNYSCGTSITLPEASDVNFTIPQGYRFVGWATWQAGSSTSSTGKVYAPGMSFAMITEDAIKNAYTGKSDSVTLYAYWRLEGQEANYTATVYVEKASRDFNGMNGYEGSGVYYRPEDDKSVGANYATAEDETGLPFTNTMTLSAVDIAPGETCYWSLTELEKHLPANTISSDQEKYLDSRTAARVVASTEKDDKGNPTSVTLYINRNLVCFDLNVLVQPLEGSRKSGSSLHFATNEGEEFDLGEAEVQVNGHSIVNGAKTDSWQIMTYGSVVTVTITPNAQYELAGYRCEVNGALETAQDSVWKGNTFTVTVKPTAAGSKSYSFSPLFNEVDTTATADLTGGDAVTLLPNWDDMTPVTVDMPTLQPDTTQTETAADAQTTPDDMLIWDASTQPMYDESFSVWDDDAATLPALGDDFAVAW